MARPRVADDFAAIRARMDELRRERQPVVKPDHSSEGRAEADRNRTVRFQLDLLRSRRRF